MNLCYPGHCVCGAQEMPGDEPCGRARADDLFAKAFLGDVDAAMALHPKPGGAPELVYLEAADDGRSKWFPVHDEAFYGYPDDDYRNDPVIVDSVEPIVTIGRGTQDLIWIRSYLKRTISDTGAPTPRSLATWGMVVWARNKTQIRDYLVKTRGLTRVQFGGKLYPLEQEKDMTTIGGGTTVNSFDGLVESARLSLERAQARADEAVQRAAVAAQAQVEAARERLERLEAMPKEPTADDSGVPPIIYFSRKFVAGGRDYDYAAIRTPNGRWNTTGPKSPKDYSWAELITWILDAPEPVEVLRARKFRDL